MNALSCCSLSAVISLVTLSPDSLTEPCRWMTGLWIAQTSVKIFHPGSVRPENILSTNKSKLYPPLIDYLKVSPLQKAAHFGLSSQDRLHQLSGDLLFLLIRQRHVPFLEPELALSTEQKHELHLKWREGQKNVNREMKRRSGWLQTYSDRHKKHHKTLY